MMMLLEERPIEAVKTSRYGYGIESVVLYTAIYGGYDVPKPLPDGLACDAVLFTDDPDISAPGWEVRVRPMEHLATFMLRHKFIKCRPDQVLDEYDVAFWVDGSMTILREDYDECCIFALGPDDVSFMLHPARRCIYDEATFSLQLPRYRGIGIEFQMEHYRQRKHPVDWGLFATGANARRIHTSASIELGRQWWHQNARWTHQDQLSLPVVVREMDRQLRWNTAIPWGEWWHIGEHVPWTGDFASWSR